MLQFQIPCGPGPEGLASRLRRIPEKIKQKSPYYILAIVCTAMFLDLVNLSAVTIALPTIQKELGVSTADLQWTVSAYALTFGGFLLLGGRGGDMFGHRNVLLFGMSLFALFTFVSALSQTFIALVIARAFQGIGAAFTIPSAQAHISIYFPDPKQKVTALGFWASSGSLGFILGLIIGGVLTDVIGWRWIFWLSLILSGIAIPAACLILPYNSVPSQRSSGEEVPASQEASRSTADILASLRRRLVRFDAIGVSMGIPGLLLLNYALTSANTLGWGSGQIIGLLVTAVVLLSVFIVHEHRATLPLMNPKLFKDISFNFTLVLAVITYAVRQACTYFLTLQLQGFGYTPLQAAILFIPLGVTAFISNTFIGRLIPRIGARKMFILGWSLSIPGVILFALISAKSSYWRYTFPGMILYISGISVVYTTANFVVVSSATKSDQGIVAGIFNVALQVGGSVLGLAVLTAVAAGIDHRYGDAGSSDAGGLSLVGYRAVYYSCIILCGLGLVVSLFGIKIPGDLLKKNTGPAEVRENDVSLENTSSSQTALGSGANEGGDRGGRDDGINHEIVDETDRVSSRDDGQEIEEIWVLKS
ncbi:hypothetical protein RUND412_007853 [Rhizina undulata]